MSGVRYVELHCHSNFSFLDGACHPEDLVERASELGYKALGLTDHTGLYGIVRFHQAAREHRIKPIFGSELTLDNNTHLTVLIKTRSGYANLSQMLSTAQLQSKKGEAKINRDNLRKHADGLIILSGCQNGEIPLLLLEGRIEEADEIACCFRDLVGSDNFYLELQHHNLPVHEQLCEMLYAMSKRLHIPVVATNNVHYTLPDGRRINDILTCIKHHTTLDNAGQLLYPNAERYLKSPEKIIRQFARYPEAIANTEKIAGECLFTLTDLETSLPDFPVPDGQTDYGYLRHRVYIGAAERYGELTRTVIDQLEHELRLINKLKLSGYFLIVWDIVRFCRENGILCQGRGSAANSAVCYCLGITAVDPIKLKLLFERFLSEERTEPPDIDIDIAHRRREEAIQYVYNKYGRQHAAMVCEVITYRGRSAVREVGKALGFSIEEVGRLAKLLHHYSSPAEAEEHIKQVRLNMDHRRVQLLVDLVKQIKRFPRHLGIHVGGMIITKKPLTQIVPIENATMPDRSVIQWDKDDAAATGMIKIDLLGLGMLSLIDHAMQLLKKHYDITIDPAKMAYDDPKVYELLSSAETVGVFQVESRAQMNTLPRHKPDHFYDLVVEVALIRPGPIQGDMVHPYLRRRNGEEEVTYPHPCLEPILKRTLGVPLFQEQGMQVAIAAAGFSPTQADELRRAMGHKRSRQKMEALSVRLIQGMVKNGIEEEAAWRIYHQLSAFADFGFAESHAASFALLVYVSAWLKVYYPAVFYCSLLNSQPMGFYTPATVIYEARRRGTNVLNVDASRSLWECTIEGDSVRLGFMYIKQLGEASKEILESRLKEKPLCTVRDWALFSGLNQRGLEQLAAAGAFDCFNKSRRDALWEILAIMRQNPTELPLSYAKNSVPDAIPVRPADPALPPMTVSEQLAADFRTKDLSTGPHPMSLVRDRLSKAGILTAADLKDTPRNRVVKVGGVVTIRQRPMTAKGFMFITLEDETGFANIVVKPQMLERFRKEIVFCSGLIVTGLLEKNEGVINVIGHHFVPLEIDDEDITIRSRDFR